MPYSSACVTSQVATAQPVLRRDPHHRDRRVAGVASDADSRPKVPPSCLAGPRSAWPRPRSPPGIPAPDRVRQCAGECRRPAPRPRRVLVVGVAVRAVLDRLRRLVDGQALVVGHRGERGEELGASRRPGPRAAWLVPQPSDGRCWKTPTESRSPVAQVRAAWTPAGPSRRRWSTARAGMARWRGHARDGGRDRGLARSPAMIGAAPVPAWQPRTPRAGPTVWDAM